MMEDKRAQKRGQSLSPLLPTLKAGIILMRAAAARSSSSFVILVKDVLATDGGDGLGDVVVGGTGTLCTSR